MRDPVQAFHAVMLAALGYTPGRIEPGKLQRFATSERRGDKAGWCKLFDDMRRGAFGCHRQGISENWCAFDSATTTREQRTEHARQVMAASAEREAQQRRQWAGMAAWPIPHARPWRFMGWCKPELLEPNNGERFGPPNDGRGRRN
jgi:hypothetical protein